MPYRKTCRRFYAPSFFCFFIERKSLEEKSNFLFFFLRMDTTTHIQKIKKYKKNFLTEKRKREKKGRNHFYSISSRCFLHTPKINKIKREKRENSFLQYLSEGVQLVSKTLWFHLLSLFLFDPKSQQFPFIIRIPIANHLIFAISIHPKGFQSIFAIFDE